MGSDNQRFHFRFNVRRTVGPLSLVWRVLLCGMALLCFGLALLFMGATLALFAAVSIVAMLFGGKRFLKITRRQLRLSSSDAVQQIRCTKSALRADDDPLV